MIYTIFLKSVQKKKEKKKRKNDLQILDINGGKGGRGLPAPFRGGGGKKGPHRLIALRQKGGGGGEKEEGRRRIQEGASKGEELFRSYRPRNGREKKKVSSHSRGKREKK